MRTNFDVGATKTDRLRARALVGTCVNGGTAGTLKAIGTRAEIRICPEAEAFQWKRFDEFAGCGGIGGGSFVGSVIEVE